MGFLTCNGENESLLQLLLLFPAALSTGGLSISALCLWCGWAWWPLFTAVKLWRFTLCLFPTAGGDVAGLLGLLGAVLELLEVLELLGVFGVVVEELPPDDTFETVSETGNVVFCWQIHYDLMYNSVITQNEYNAITCTSCGRGWLVVCILREWSVGIRGVVSSLVGVGGATLDGPGCALIA